MKCLFNNFGVYKSAAFVSEAWERSQVGLFVQYLEVMVLVWLWFYVAVSLFRLDVLCMHDTIIYLNQSMFITCYDNIFYQIRACSSSYSL